MLADDAQPHDENRKLAKHLYAEKEACSLPHTRRRRCHELAAEQAIARRREPQGLGRNRTWRGAATQARMMSLIRTAAQQNLDVIESSHASPGTHAGGRTAAFRVERLLLRSSFIEMG